MTLKLYCTKCDTDLKQTSDDRLLDPINYDPSDGHQVYQFDLSGYICECPLDDEATTSWTLLDIGSNANLLTTELFAVRSKRYSKAVSQAYQDGRNDGEAYGRADERSRARNKPGDGDMGG